MTKRATRHLAAAGAALPRLAAVRSARLSVHYAGDGKRRIRGEQLVTQVAAR